ncbi:uncharacterized protein [Ptychodera flava]|uniref:uncharacterized protein n=1 Tax=Ptychodera flava TaxID=63121 RepID=UPI00396A357A
MKYDVRQTELTIDSITISDGVINDPSADEHSRPESSKIPLPIRAALYLMGYFNICRVPKKDLCRWCSAIKARAYQFAKSTPAELLLGMADQERDGVTTHDRSSIENQRVDSLVPICDIDGCSGSISSTNNQLEESCCSECGVNGAISVNVKPRKLHGTVSSKNRE